MLDYLKEFNCVQTKCAKKLALTHLKIRLPTNYWLTNHMNNHLTISKQMSSGSFKNIIYKVYVYKS